MELIRDYFPSLSEEQYDQFARLDSLYREWNEKINVISRKDIESLYEKHILHSLSIAASFKFADRLRVLDIGTGGGFPGIPLAIFFKNVHFHCADSIGKKIKVVEAVASALELRNITAQHIRAEEIKNEKFDLVVSRAVAPLKDLWRWSQAVLKKPSANISPTGLICLKGGDLAQEISESQCRPRITNITNYFKESFFEEKFILHVRN